MQRSAAPKSASQITDERLTDQGNTECRPLVDAPTEDAIMDDPAFTLSMDSFHSIPPQNLQPRALPKEASYIHSPTNQFLQSFVDFSSPKHPSPSHAVGGDDTLIQEGGDSSFWQLTDLGLASPGLFSFNLPSPPSSATETITVTDLDPFLPHSDHDDPSTTHSKTSAIPPHGPDRAPQQVQETTELESSTPSVDVLHPRSPIVITGSSPDRVDEQHVADLPLLSDDLDEIGLHGFGDGQLSTDAQDWALAVQEHCSGRISSNYQIANLPLCQPSIPNSSLLSDSGSPFDAFLYKHCEFKLREGVSLGLVSLTRCSLRRPSTLPTSAWFGL